MDKLSKIYHLVRSRLKPAGLYLVSEPGEWAFARISEYISSTLREQGLASPTVLRDNECLHLLKHQIIHFINRYAALGGMTHRIHPSNRIFMNWFHGSRSDPNPGIHRLLTRIKEEEERIDKIIVSCEIGRNNLIDEGISPSKLIRIPLGVDLNIFTRPSAKEKALLRKRLGIPEHSFCIGSFQKDGVGWGEGMEPKLVKGPDIFLEVITRLKETSDRLFVLLTGPARGYIIKGLKKAGVRYHHCFLDQYQKMSEMFKCLDLYLITSRDEGGPMSLLESWATGVPVVSTRVGMPNDLITHEQNGMLAEIDDVNGLVHNADKLYDDNHLRDSLAENALREVVDYSWYKTAIKYFDLLYADLNLPSD